MRKLKYYTLRKKDYFRKLLWVAVAINAAANAADSSRGNVIPLVKSRSKAPGMKTIPVRGLAIPCLIWLIPEY